MTTTDKLIVKLHRSRTNFTYNEAVSLLLKLGCKETKSAKGSSVAFVHDRTGRICQFHRPHPGNNLKPYQIQILKEYCNDIRGE